MPLLKFLSITLFLNFTNNKLVKAISLFVNKAPFFGNILLFFLREIATLFEFKLSLYFSFKLCNSLISNLLPSAGKYISSVLKSEFAVPVTTRPTPSIIKLLSTHIEALFFLNSHLLINSTIFCITLSLLEFFKSNSMIV